MEIDRASWPAGGRVGFITKGDYAGSYLLLSVEVDSWWAFYISEDPHEKSPQAIKSDDFWASDEEVPGIVAEMAVQWVDASMDEDVEREIFDIRSEWRKRRRRRELVRSLFSFLGRRG
ncbi:hypothetical protein ACIP93_37235 [Streptomyces sp. NPDC088745]|uniref:hypothetical protein n=1 Tax=Streptomyces sp. NPDC088745 TaxID=3365884 RepID=UPI00381F15AA